MKLTSAQVERTLGQLEARAIPDDHPVIPQLTTYSGNTRSSSTAMGSISWAGRGRRRGGGSVGQGRESCQLERRRPDWSRASRA